MTSVLGYPRYGSQGGDWGSLVASWLGVDFPHHIVAIHINLMGLRPYTGEGSLPLNPAEEAWVAKARDQLRRESGYRAIQGTKPQTLAYASRTRPWAWRRGSSRSSTGGATPPRRNRRSRWSNSSPT